MWLVNTETTAVAVFILFQPAPGTLITKTATFGWSRTCPHWVWGHARNLLQKNKQIHVCMFWLTDFISIIFFAIPMVKRNVAYLLYIGTFLLSAHSSLRWQHITDMVAQLIGVLYSFSSALWTNKIQPLQFLDTPASQPESVDFCCS